MIHYKKVIERFRIPEAGSDILEQMLNARECALLSGWKGKETFSEGELSEFLCDSKLAADSVEAKAFILQCFQRGVLDKTEDDQYCFGSFYGRLDIFATSEAEDYRRLSEKKRKELDRWYFSCYLERLSKSTGASPTDDQVLPLEETLAFIEKKKEQPYLALCDCRMLTGDCGSPTKTCITYRTGVNSFVSRGHATPISIEEAKQVVIEADRAGLMHTVNSGGVCNCCTDCCYLFRAARARKSQGIWPASYYQVELNSERCVGCGACIKKCHFQVFQKKQQHGKTKFKAELIHEEACVGCGICVNGCPVGALCLKEAWHTLGGNE